MPPLIGSGRETRHVAHYATAQCHHGGVAVVTRLNQRIKDGGIGPQGLELLAIADLNTVDLRCVAEARPQLV